MKIRYEDARLERLAKDRSFTNGFSKELVNTYRMRIQQIDDALDERDFYRWKALHFEKLKGDRKGQYSMRLNKQWRLILRLEQGANGKWAVIVEIVDYH